jgi:hypothetical protein
LSYGSSILGLPAPIGHRRCVFRVSKTEKLPAELATLFPLGGKELTPYFRPPKFNRDDRIWHKINRDAEAVLKDYHKKAERSLAHDEPWLTMVALYGLFGEQNGPPSQQTTALVNDLLRKVYAGRKLPGEAPVFDKVTSVHTEVHLHENVLFREHFLRLNDPEAYHPYSDRKKTLEKKVKGERPSIEGNTNLDVLISGKIGTRMCHVFIEAKFLSDISKDISYLTARNQIIRNIDAAMYLMTLDGSGARMAAPELSGLDDFWFILLTPGVFRTNAFGCRSASNIDSFQPDRSRLYCYKMDEYLQPEKLRDELPHWADLLTDMAVWNRLSARIGWLTFEDIRKVVVDNKLLNESKLQSFGEFLDHREIK